MSSAIFILRSMGRARKERDKLVAERGRKVEQYRKKLEKADAARDKELSSTIAAMEARLVDHNRFKVGDIIQAVAGDGLLGGPKYQVTRVKDHECFWARLITAKGKLGATTEYFRKGQSYGRFDPLKYKKIGRGTAQ